MTDGRSIRIRRIVLASAAALLLSLGLLVTQARTAPGCTTQTVKTGIVTATACFTRTANRYTADGVVDLNGFTVYATPQAPLSIETDTRRVSNGGKTVDFAVRGLPSQSNPSKVPIKGINFVAPLSGELPLENLRLVPPVLAGLAGVGAGNVSVPVSLVEEDCRPNEAPPCKQGEVDFTYGLPTILAIRGTGASASAEFDVKPGVGAVVNGVDFEADGLTFANVFGINHFDANYRAAENSFGGSIELIFPNFTKAKLGNDGIALGAGFQVVNGNFKSFKVSGDNLDAPLVPGVDLQRIAGGIEVTPSFGFFVAAEATAGPQLTLPFIEPKPPHKVALLRIGGDVQLKTPYGQTPGNLRLGASMRLLNNIKLANADLSMDVYSATQRPPNGALGLVTFNSRVELGLPNFTQSRNNPLYVGGGIRGWALDKQFNFEGDVRLTVLGWDVAGAQAVFSDRGIAACVKPIWWSPWVGGGYMFGPRKFDLLVGWSCGIGGYRNPDRVVARAAPPAAGAAPPGAASTAGSRAVVVDTLDLKRDEQIIRLDGDERVPKFEMTSEDGTTVKRRRDTDEPIFGPDRDWVVLSDQRTNTAYVLLKDPAGEWSLDGHGGRSEIVDIDIAESVPPPEVSAHVTGSGRHRVLHWSADGMQPRDRIAFSEKVRGDVARPVVKTDERSGSFRFRPRLGPHGNHTLKAIVTRSGTPFDELNVDEFTVRPPRPPARPQRLRVLQRRHDVVVRWRRAPRARGYVAVLKGAGGSFAIPKTTRPSRRRVSFQSPPVTTRMKVQVYAIGKLGAPGKPATRTFRTRSRLKTVEAAARRLVRSANPLGDGDLELLGACPARGHCRAAVAIRRHGRVIGHRNAVLVPDTLRDLIVEIDDKARRRLERRGRLRVTVEATIQQGQRLATKRRGLTLRVGD